MVPYVLQIREADRARVALVGGKGASLGEVSRIPGVRVPAGFCVTTHAFHRAVEGAAGVDALLQRLAGLRADDTEAISALAAEIRRGIEDAPVPDDVAAAVAGALAGLGPRTRLAVRSSATAEDSAAASFAGQHDTYLDVPAADVPGRIRACWASLFTDRAVAYRMHHGMDHRAAGMAVVVQQMVAADASGVLFTADPVTGDRRVASVEAVRGPGEALVGGTATPDVIRVRDDRVLETIAAAPAGPVLTETQAVQLVRLGRVIEAHFGCPQDIEWCLSDDGVHIVQSRPITTLFPIPGDDDGRPHVFISVGHQQMMTDPMTPLGISVWQLTSLAPMREAGARLFVDATRNLASPTTRAPLLELIGRSDPLIADALRAVLDRPDFVLPEPEDAPPPPPSSGPEGPLDPDPALVHELIRLGEASVEELERGIAPLSGPALLEFIRGDIRGEGRRILFDPQSRRVYMTAMEATWWLNDRLAEWLGETNAADVLTRSVPHNITSQMGLDLLDVADAVRQHPRVVAFLGTVDADDDGFLDRLGGLEGGPQAGDALLGWLARYGMRCVGEIDITRPRWSERPAALVPLILGNVRNFAHGEGRRRFEEGLREAEAWERRLLQRVRALPDGDARAAETKLQIDRVRAFMGYREYPKYGLVRRYFAYKRALMGEVDRLVAAGVLAERDDAFFLRFEELEEVVRTHQVDHELIRRRREAFRAAHALTPPRVITSHGEALAGAYRREGLPAGALVGLAVSAGTVEGRARVILDMAQADLQPGDILVTAHTDPSWTPLFVTVAGLVTEVGGQMTHGAVIAREYGLPAVVGVEHATRLIGDGQRIRVDGTGGFVEVVPPPDA